MRYNKISMLSKVNRKNDIDQEIVVAKKISKRILMYAIYRLGISKYEYSTIMKEIS